MEEVTSEQFVNFNKVYHSVLGNPHVLTSYQGILVGMYAWTTSNTLIRISTILLYLRIFPVRMFNHLCWVFMVLNVAYAFGTYIVALLICRPIDSLWAPTTSGDQCGNLERLYLWHGIQNLIHDIILVAMPMPLLWRLHLPIGKKVSLILIFAMGLS